MTNEDYFVVVSKVPERLSKYTRSLRELSSDFLFFSDATSLVDRPWCARLRLVVIDNVDGSHRVVETIKRIKALKAFEALPILMITSDGGAEIGIAALDAGANDYLPESVVDKELPVRARMHLNSYKKESVFLQHGIDLSQIYPLEDRRLIKRALTYIDSDISSVKKIEDLILHVGRSAEHINRAFKTHLGQTAFQYIRDLRISKAKEMLFKTRIPIIQIAQELGYSSAANFSTAFKDIVGVSPSQYRKVNIR